MNIQEKVQRAKKLVDSIATHDDDSVADVQGALEEVADYAEEASTQAKVRRLGSGLTRFFRYWTQLGKALIGRA